MIKLSVVLLSLSLRDKSHRLHYVYSIIGPTPATTTIMNCQWQHIDQCQTDEIIHYEDDELHVDLIDWGMANVEAYELGKHCIICI